MVNKSTIYSFNILLFNNIRKLSGYVCYSLGRFWILIKGRNLVIKNDVILYNV